jgi:phage gpG-like protein
MAGAGIVKAEYNESEFQAIIDALGKASAPDLFKIAESAGAELDFISKKAFEREKDPVTGKPWEPLKRPNESGKILHGKSYHLKRTLDWEAFPDGSVIFGSNMEYARIHQEGGKTKAHEIVPYKAKALYFNGGFAKKVNHPGSDIPPRPYMGVTKDFDRNFLNDPGVLELLGLGG